MAALREVLAHFGFEFDEAKLDKAHDKVESFTEKVEGYAKKAAAAFGVYEVWEFAKSTAEAIDKVNDKAAELGISAESVQLFGFAARAAGQDGDALLAGMGRLQVAAAGVEEGAGGAGAALGKLGIHVKDASGHMKGADVLLEDVADKIAETHDAAKRAAIATEIFGRQGRALLPFLTRGREGVEELREQFKLMGGGFDEGANKAAEEFNFQLASGGVLADSIRGEFAKGLLPILTAIAKKALQFGGTLLSFVKNTDLVRNGLIALAVAVGPALFAAFAPITLAAAGIAALVLFADDLITMFSGGQSVIGDALDEIWGSGTQEKARKFLGDVVGFFKQAWTVIKEQIWPWMKRVFDTAAKFAGLLEMNPAVAKGGPDEFDKEEIRRRGAMQGRVVVFADESREYAQTQANKYRADEGMAPIGAPATTTVAGRGGGGSTVTQQNTVNVNIGKTNATPEDIEHHVGKALDKHTRAAHQALTQAPE